MAAELGWDPARTQRELEEYRQAVAADLAAQAEPDEKAAYQARVAGRRSRRLLPDRRPLTTSRAHPDQNGTFSSV